MIMFTNVAIVFLCLLVLCAKGVSSNKYYSETNTPKQPMRRLISGQFIVVLRPGVSLHEHLKALGLGAAGQTDLTIQDARQTVLHSYQHVLHGYALHCSDMFLSQVRARTHEVLIVEQDEFLTTEVIDNHSDVPSFSLPKENSIFRGEQRFPPSWGLDRVDQHDLPLDNFYRYPDAAGEGVDVFSLDTGIDISHDDFEGRAIWGKTTVPGSADRDGNGHGTHVIGTIIGKTFGVAKKSTAIAVKVFNDAGFGSIADVIAGLEYVAETVDQRGRPSVVVMALGGSKSQTLDEAVASIVRTGTVVVTVAGSSGTDACLFSPGGVPEALTVAVSDINDQFNPSSNRGTCVKLLAPGVSITSTWPGNSNRTLSGSAMACAHVSGAVALLRSEHPDLTPSQIESLLQKVATDGAVSDVPSDTVNLLLFVESDEKDSKTNK